MKTKLLGRGKWLCSPPNCVPAPPRQRDAALHSPCSVCLCSYDTCIWCSALNSGRKKKKAGQKLEIALQRRRAKGGTAHPRSHTAPCWPSPLAHGPLSPSPLEAHALTVKWRYTTSLGLAWPGWMIYLLRCRKTLMEQTCIE